MRAEMALRFLVAMVLLRCVASYEHFRGQIPNGQSVPSPCNQTDVWPGVGHFLISGGGPRNSFGVDFLKENRTWTVDLCKRDSDGDGRTNGEELGDPDCTWKVGERPKEETNITHPGICEPLNSTKCVSKKDDGPLSYRESICKSNNFICDGIHEQGVKNVSLTLPKGSRVPPKVTTYMCQIFDFEVMTSPGDYDLIAMEPVIDNTHVMHHIIMFGCSDEATPLDTPTECGMSVDFCEAMIGSWTLGLSGFCLHQDTGIRVGAGGYKKVAIQLHWNNPLKENLHTDGSGLKLYYTSQRRRYEAIFIMTGVTNFELPPLTMTTQLTSSCSSSMTRDMIESGVYVTMAANHMHYTGTKMSVQLMRNDTFIENITNDETYTYDSPVVNFYTDNPVKILPGDEIITRCEYSTLDRDTPTKFGKATRDEMCFGFLVVYPMENLRTHECVTHQEDQSEMCLDWIGDETRFKGSYLYKELLQSCGDSANCSDECSRSISDLRRETNCLRNNVFRRFKNSLNVSHELVAWMSGCEVKASTTAMVPHNRNSCSTTSTSLWSFLVIFVSFLLAIT